MAASTCIHSKECQCSSSYPGRGFAEAQQPSHTVAPPLCLTACMLLATGRDVVNHALGHWQRRGRPMSCPAHDRPGCVLCAEHAGLHSAVTSSVSGQHVGVQQMQSPCTLQRALLTARAVRRSGRARRTTAGRCTCITSCWPTSRPGTGAWGLRGWDPCPSESSTCAAASL